MSKVVAILFEVIPKGARLLAKFYQAAWVITFVVVQDAERLWAA